MWLSDMKVVLPDGILEHGSVRIEDGVIAEIIEGTAPVDAPTMGGLTLIPGIIDLHGDMLERDVQPRPNARFPTELGLIELDKRMAGAGITTAFAAISFAWKQNDLRSQESATEMINTVNAMRDALLIDMQVHARFEVTNPSTAPVLAELLSEDKVQLVSIMDHTPGQGQYGDVDRYLDFMHKWMGIDLDNLGEFKDKILTSIRNNIVETVAKPRDWSIIADVMRIAKTHGIPVASHDDDTPQKVQEQAEIGISISEFPVSVEAAEAAHKHGMKVIMGAPNAYRGQSTSNNLSAIDAIKAGLVDILATDYYPASMLHTAFKLVKEGVMPLHESVKLISTNAAEAMHYHDKGRIAQGYSADLVLVEEGDDYPRVRGTIRHGVPIFWDSHMVKLSQLSTLYYGKTPSKA